MELTSSYFSLVFICFDLPLTYLEEERLKARMAELEAKLQAQGRDEIEIIQESEILIFMGMPNKSRPQLFSFLSDIACR